MAVGPRLDQIVLQRLELVRLSSERLVLVLSLHGGAVRTIFVEVGEQIADNALAEVSVVLNERLAGLTLSEIRSSLAARLRDAKSIVGGHELLNIFVQERESIFDDPLKRDESLVLGQTSVLAEQPEFASSDKMRRLLDAYGIERAFDGDPPPAPREPRRVDHDRQRARRSALRELHDRDLGVPCWLARGRHRRDWPDANAVREGDRRGHPCVETRVGPARLTPLRLSSTQRHPATSTTTQQQAAQNFELASRLYG